MSGSVNKAIVVGNLGKDPEVRTFQNGGKVASFSVATSETWKDRQTGEKKEDTQWHNISVFGEGLVGVVERFLRKGSKVYIEGKMKTRKWTDRNQVERYTTEVVVQGPGSNITMLDGKNNQRGGGDSGGGGGSAGSRSNDRDDGWGGGGSSGGGGGFGGGFGGSEGFDDLNDDVPF